MTKAQGETVGTTGGYTVPVEIEDQIIALRDVAGVFRREARVRPMGSDSRSMPRRTGGLTAYFLGENSAIAELQANWDNTELRAKKLGALTRVSGELSEDAAADVAQDFVEEMGFTFADMEDGCGFLGDGTSTYGGITGICPRLLDGAHDASKLVATMGHDTFLELDATDLANLMAKLPERHWPGAKFYCSGFAAASTFVRLGATTGGTIMTARGPRPQLAYAGIPIVLTPKLPGTGDQSGAVMVLFGDLSAAATVGSRREMTVMASRNRSGSFHLDQIGIRGTERMDIVTHELGNNSVAGAIVGLVGE